MYQWILDIVSRVYPGEAWDPSGCYRVRDLMSSLEACGADQKLSQFLVETQSIKFSCMLQRAYGGPE